MGKRLPDGSGSLSLFVGGFWYASSGCGKQVKKESYMRIKDARFIDAGDIRTRYFEAGKGTPLLLIHGGSMGFAATALDWDTVFDRLAESFHVFAIDKIGQGYTDNPKSDAEHAIASTYTHAYNFAKAVGISGFFVAGHSRGAYPACRLALEHPDVVKGLIVVDSGTLMHTRNPWYGDVSAKAAKVANVRERVKYVAVANCYSDRNATKEWIDDLEAVYKLPKTKEALAKHAEVFERFESELGEWQKSFHARVKAGEMKVPVLIVWGYNDPSSPLTTIGMKVMDLFFQARPEQSRRGVPGTQMHILDQAGHYSYRDQPEQFVAAVTSFIKG